MLIGSMANTLNAGGGFCAGSKVVTEHQVRPALTRADRTVADKSYHI